MSDLLHAIELGLDMLEQAMNTVTFEPYNPHKTRPADEPEPSAQVARESREIFGAQEISESNK